MEIIPIELRTANEFIVKYHRHHGSVIQHKYSIGLLNEGHLIGVAINGRPRARILDNGKTIEVIRLCVMDEIKNVCSMLYGACARIAREMGYEKIITYILKSETGISLLASGWILENSECGGKSWNTKSRERFDVDLFGNKKYPDEKKQRWVKIFKLPEANDGNKR